MGVGTASPRQGSFFFWLKPKGVEFDEAPNSLGEPKVLQRCDRKLEDPLFGATEQANEQVSEQV